MSILPNFAQRAQRQARSKRWLTLVSGLLASVASPSFSNALAASCDVACVTERTAQNPAPNLRALSATLTPASPAINWLPDGRRFTYAREMPDGVDLYIVDPASASRERLIRLSELVRAAQLDVDVSKASASSFQSTAEGNGAVFTHRGSRYTMDLATGTVVKTSATTNFATSPNGKYRVFTREHDLYSQGPEGREIRLSDDSAKWYSFSAAVADTQPTDTAILEDTLDNKPPMIGWIGDGPYFYVQRQDLRNTGNLWQVDAFAGARPRLITKKMPMPGEAKSPPVELWVFDARGGEPVRIKTDDWPYMGNLDVGYGGIWPSADEKSLHFARFARGYKAVELCRADLRTGEVQIILRESPPDNFSVRYAEFHPLSNGFLWKTDRTGYQQYGLYTWSGKFVRNVTPGNTVAREILSVNRNTKSILYASYDDASVRNPRQIRIKRAFWETGRSVPLDREDAHHEVSVSPSGEFYVDTYSRADLAPTMVVRNADGRVVMTVERSDVGPLLATGWRAPERIRVMAADDKTPLYGVLWKPTEKSDVKLPIVAHVYPGPSGENPPYRFMPGHSDGQLAQLGFAVLRVGQRGGTFVRGKAYQRYPLTVGSVRDYPIADNMAAIRAVAKTHTSLDLDKVGIMGHSGGGFMAATAILSEPDFYKVAISASGNHDNNIYEMGSGEYHFGNPFSGPAGSPNGFAVNQDLAAGLQGKLLLIHGALDSDVDMGHSYRLMQALIEKGKTFDTLIMPRQRHDFTGTDADYVEKRSWAYLVENLQ